MHWALKYIGKPWVSGARGPDAFDCWGLLYDVYQSRYALELPLYGSIDAHDMSSIMRLINFGAQEKVWAQTNKPRDGYAVGMSQNVYFHHVGIYCDVDGGLIMHSADRRGVVAQSPATLRMQGWNRMEYFSHHGARYTHH